jgi:hypothetical protein
MEEKDPFFGVEDGNNEKNLRRMTMRMTVMKRMTMTKGKWRGGVRESEKLKKPEESTKSEESEETGEEGVSGKKVNDNGTDSDNDSDEETNKKKMR